MHFISLLLTVPSLALGELFARDDASEGGGDPGAAGSGGPALSNWVGRPGQSPMEPIRDPFYNQTLTDLTRYKNGDIIDQRPISLSGTYQGVSLAYQLLIRTEDAHGTPSYSWATVLIPEERTYNGNVVAFQNPEDAIFIDCAPSFQIFSKTPIAEVQSLISNGFTVVVPDYEGPRGSYSVGKIGGKIVLDAARAALKIPRVKASNGSMTNVGLWGYGMGAHSTGWAAEIAKTYAPELPVKAAAMGGLVSNLVSWMDAVNSSPNSALAVTSLLGMATEYRDVSDAVSDYVIPRKRSQFEGASTRCFGSNKLHYFMANMTSQFFTPGIDVLQMPKVQNVYELNSLGKKAPQLSLYVYQGTQDNIAQMWATRNLLKSYCGNGTTVKYREIPGASHVQARAQYDSVIDYFSSALSGSFFSNSCERIEHGDFY